MLYSKLNNFKKKLKRKLKKFTSHSAVKSEISHKKGGDLRTSQSIIRILLWIANHKDTTPQDKNDIINSLIAKVGFYPISDVIKYDHQGTILINNKPISAEQAVSLRENAISLKRNNCFNLIEEQLAWEAIKYGVHSSTSNDMLILSKAILWAQEQRKKILQNLTGDFEN